MIEGDPWVADGPASVFTYNGSSLSAGTALTPPSGAVSFGTSVRFGQRAGGPGR